MPHALNLWAITVPIRPAYRALIAHARRPDGASSRLFLAIAGWAVVCWVVFGWRLGYPSFWDPDEATYAETTREMLAAHNWLVPVYDGQPFFDKPPLFYILQMASFAAVGATELAARIVPAISALGLLAGRRLVWATLFNRDVGRNGALMFAVLPATFALSSYAIVDMTFTLFLFGGCALVIVSAFKNRPHLQYAGYVLLAAAVLTKGPLALVLAGLAFLISLALAPEARAPLLRLRWALGLLIITALSAPWFLYMWRHFGDAFVTGYVLKENLWLFVGIAVRRAALDAVLPEGDPRRAASLDPAADRQAHRCGARAAHPRPRNGCSGRGPSPLLVSSRCRGSSSITTCSRPHRRSVSSVRGLGANCGMRNRGQSAPCPGLSRFRSCSLSRASS